MQSLFATLDTRAPKWTLEQSLIGVNPGLGFRPISTNTDEGSLIWYNKTNNKTSEKWVELVNRFLERKSLEFLILHEIFRSCCFKYANYPVIYLLIIYLDNIKQIVVW